ncbi:hypothetical protein HDU90_003060 [Geranomyces variabilis]|nr:hypothetical protein HDU90_003060 [Geranomyces variabilis]
METQIERPAPAATAAHNPRFLPRQVTVIIPSAPFEKGGSDADTAAAKSSAFPQSLGKQISFYVPQDLDDSGITGADAHPAALTRRADQVPLAAAGSLVDVGPLPPGVTAHSWKGRPGAVYFADWANRRCSWVDPRGPAGATTTTAYRSANNLSQARLTAASSRYDSWPSAVALGPAVSPAVESHVGTAMGYVPFRAPSGYGSFRHPSMYGSLAALRPTESYEPPRAPAAAASTLRVSSQSALSQKRRSTLNVRSDADSTLLDRQEEELLKRENESLERDLEECRRQMARLNEITLQIDAENIKHGKVEKHRDQLTS